MINICRDTSHMHWGNMQAKTFALMSAHPVFSAFDRLLLSWSHRAVSPSSCTWFLKLSSSLSLEPGHPNTAGKSINSMKCINLTHFYWTHTKKDKKVTTGWHSLIIDISMWTLDSEIMLSQSEATLHDQHQHLSTLGTDVWRTLLPFYIISKLLKTFLTDIELQPFQRDRIYKTSPLPWVRPLWWAHWESETFPLHCEISCHSSSCMSQGPGNYFL